MKEIKIIKKTLATKDGKKFDVFKAVQKNGKLIDCKFTKEVKEKPSKSCTIKVDENYMNVDNSRLYACLWIKKIEEIIDNPTDNKGFNDFFDEVE